nr:uncharacterized protein LOC111416892 [Onthophagus taurus]XP_022915665.1 uncharacterized protein LOC111425693 [Onthophagus taurus]
MPYIYIYTPTYVCPDKLPGVTSSTVMQVYPGCSKQQGCEIASTSFCEENSVISLEMNWKRFHLSDEKEIIDKKRRKLPFTKNCSNCNLTGVKKALCRAKKNARIIRQKLIQLRKNPQVLVNLKYLNKETRNFFSSQSRNQKKEVLALSIYKQSGKGYRFLSNFFSLPSRKTLQKLLG